MKNKIRVAIIGCGNMARAIISAMTDPATKSALKANGDVFEITVADHNEANLMPIKRICSVTTDNAAAARAADFVVLCVKSQSAESAVSGVDLSEKVVISIMAGYDIAKLKALTSSNRIIRVMPNLCARVGESYNAYATYGVDGETLTSALEILGSFGVCREVSESDMCAVTGITGSGPAFVFSALKAFYDEAVSRGFSHSDAKAMAIQTVVGSALTAEKSEDGFDALISSVCSKGGTTERGVAYLKERGFEDALRGAICKSIERAEEMQK